MTTAEQTPKITALAPWFGAKRTLAPRIVEALGEHKAYWEPFAGSMAVLMSKPACRLETVNDLHGDLINLARVVRNRETARKLYDEARGIFCSDQELFDADSRIRRTTAPDEPDVARALDYMVVCWMGRNGECGLSSSERAKTLCIRWTNNGGSPATRWRAAIQSIAAWHRRLARVVVTRRCGLEMLEKIADEPDGAIYCDPPYVVKSDKYVHDFSHADHCRLAELLRRFKRARVVVSYYEHPLIDELYRGWRKVVIEANKGLANQTRGREGATKAPEVLLINHAAPVSKTLF